jgi:hypothetical protein
MFLARKDSAADAGLLSPLSVVDFVELSHVIEREEVESVDVLHVSKDLTSA